MKVAEQPHQLRLNRSKTVPARKLKRAQRGFAGFCQRGAEHLDRGQRSARPNPHAEKAVGRGPFDCFVQQIVRVHQATGQCVSRTKIAHRRWDQEGDIARPRQSQRFLKLRYRVKRLFLEEQTKTSAYTRIADIEWLAGLLGYPASL